MKFGERMGFAEEKTMQIESIDERLCNRLSNALRDFLYMDLQDLDGMTQYILDELGENNGLLGGYAYEKIEQIFHGEDARYPWYIPYEIIESAIQAKVRVKKYEDAMNPFYGFSSVHEDQKSIKEFSEKINNILESEKSGYRLSVETGTFLKITNRIEMESIEESIHNLTESKFFGVAEHMKNAASLYSDREHPDYNNSIKESISAVEAMCRIITNCEGKTTLDDALKKLKDNGIHIHPAMETGFIKLYGYTCDEPGIRHGSIQYSEAPEEDAKFMLVACSAFVNYLKAKYCE